MNRTVCLVILNPEQTASSAVREALQADAHRVAKLVHPNIITLYDINTVGTRVYFVEEYLPGTDIQTLLNQQGQLTVGQAAAVVQQAARGLHHAHEQAIVHGRLQPRSSPRPRPGASPGMQRGERNARHPLRRGSSTSSTR